MQKSLQRELVVDRSNCIGCAMCVAMAPEVFEMEKGRAKVRDQTGTCESMIESIINSCPQQAITWKEK